MDWPRLLHILVIFVLPLASVKYGWYLVQSVDLVFGVVDAQLVGPLDGRSSAVGLGQEVNHSKTTRLVRNCDKKTFFRAQI